MVYAQPRIVQDNKKHKIIWDFEIQTDHLISTRRPEPMIIYEKRKKEINKKRTCRIVDFAVPADHRIKLKESKKKKKNDKYLDPARGLKKLGNMKMTVIPIVIGALGTVTKWLVKGPPQLQYYWNQPEYWEESWRLEETCCHSNPMSNHRLTLVWKTRKGVTIIKRKMYKITHSHL